MQAPTCGEAMGCDGVKCIWEGGRRGCAKWCRAHAAKWIPSLLVAMKCAEDQTAPLAFSVDRLVYDGLRGLYIRSINGKNKAEVARRLVSDDKDDKGTTEMEDAELAEMVSAGTVRAVSVTVTACGLYGNPPDSVVSEWESQYTPLDLLEFSKFKGYPKRLVRVGRSTNKIQTGKDNEYLVMEPDGVYREGSSKYAHDCILAIMSDPGLKGSRLIFQFNLQISDIPAADNTNACRVLDVPDASGKCSYRSVAGGVSRSYLMRHMTGSNPSSSSKTGPAVEEDIRQGGAHISLDCGKFVAHWHTLAEMSLTIDSVYGTRMTADAVLFW